MSVGAGQRTCTLNAKLVPSCGVLFGAFVKPLDGQTPEQAFQGLETLTGHTMQVEHFYYQGTQMFPAQWQIDLANQPDAHRVILANWMPEQGHTWAQVAAGASDAYIDREAAYLKANFTQKFYLVIHHEPEDEVNETTGSGFTALDYAAMYRHVETRLETDGITNAVYVMNYMGAQTYGVRSWFPQLWPGDKYVDWIAFDRYATATLGGQKGDFSTMVNLHWGDGPWHGSYRWALANHPGKPIMLAEWGVGEKAGVPLWKKEFFKTTSDNLRGLPHLKLICYFDSPDPDNGGDVRPNTTQASLQGWQGMDAEPMFHRLGG